MPRVLRPGGTLLLADARIPSIGPWHLLAALTGHLHMAEMVPPLGPLTAEAGFADIHGSDAPPWLSYVVGIKRASVSCGRTAGGSSRCARGNRCSTSQATVEVA
jgi:hypothetical protein